MAVWWAMTSPRAQAGEELDYGDRLFSGAFLLFDLPHLFFYQEGLFSLSGAKNCRRLGPMPTLPTINCCLKWPSSKGTYLGFDNGDVYVFDGMKDEPAWGHLAK
jgi:hypothetical protein